MTEPEPDPAPPPAARGWSIRRAAAAVALLTAVSTALGLVRDIVIAAVFGAGADLDAYLVAQGVMNLVLAVIAGAMAKSVTPQVAREAVAEGPQSGDGARAQRPCAGHRSFDVSITVTVGVLGVASLVAALFAAPVTAVLAPGFSPGEAALAAELTRWILLATVLVAGTNLLAAFGHAHGRFRWAALEGIPFNLAMIVAAAAFGPRFGVHALVGGFVVGSALRLCVQLVPVRALRSPIRPSLDVRDPGFRAIAAMVPALVLTSAVGNVNALVDRAVATTVADGAVTALAFGWRFVHLAETLLIAALLVPLYPAIAAVTEDLERRRRLIADGLAASLVLTVPLAAGLAVAAPELTAVVFGHGNYDAAAVTATATATLWYAPALAAIGLRAVMIRASQAVGDARGLLWVSAAAMVVNVIGDLVLGPLFGIPGLAGATSLSIAFAALLNGALLARRHRAIDLRALAATCARVFGVAAAAAVSALGVRALLVAGGLPDLAVLAGVALALLGAYAGLAFALRIPERTVLTQVAELVTRRRGR